MLKWVLFIRYPDGADKEAADQWYLNVHTQDARTLAGKGVVSYRTYRCVDAQFPPPWSAGVAEFNDWDRVTEFEFRDWDGWRESFTENDPAWRPPDFDVPETPEVPGSLVRGRGVGGFESVSCFIETEPEYDLLSETPPGAVPAQR